MQSLVRQLAGRCEAVNVVTGPLYLPSLMPAGRFAMSYPLIGEHKIQWSCSAVYSSSCELGWGMPSFVKQLAGGWEPPWSLPDACRWVCQDLPSQVRPCLHSGCCQLSAGSGRCMDLLSSSRA